jgi:hypothetical protein
MLLCAIATTLPRVMVSAASHQSTTAHSTWIGASVSRKNRAAAIIAAALMPTVISAVTTVGDPW